jgi:hypothetical protein
LQLKEKLAFAGKSTLGGKLRLQENLNFRKNSLAGKFSNSEKIAAYKKFNVRK